MGFWAAGTGGRKGERRDEKLHAVVLRKGRRLGLWVVVRKGKGRKERKKKIG